MRLAEVERAASTLALLSADILMFEAVWVVADDVLRACEALKQRVGQLHKTEFAEQIIDEQALYELDKIVDGDAISEVEQRLSAAWPDADNHPVGELLRQMLAKLEKHYASMSQSIQQLAALLSQ